MATRAQTRTQTHASSPGRGEIEPVTLVVTDGASRGVRLTITRGSVVVGSDPSCDLVIEDPTVSGRHATIGVVPAGVQVKDLGSRNGTRYLGAKIESATVSTGSEIKFGRTRVQVTVPTVSEPEGELDETLGLLGQSPSMKRLFAKLPKVAKSGASVLITGETGTGKSEIARVIHSLSSRADKPFVTVDCAAIAKGLMESALFGYVKGAFTGADRDREGLVGAAEGGTLFLDEVGELPIDAQPTLLRLLEAKDYLPVGATRRRATEVRVIAATLKDLEAEARAGRFRRDLFFRLAGVELTVPPLRARREDIAPLARLFAHQLTSVDVRLAPATLAAFQCEPWPGNVRELKNAVARALTLGATGDQASSARPSFTEARDEALLHFERDFLVALLEENGGNVSAAARAAKLGRSYFYTLLERHRLVSRPTRRE